MSPKQSDVNRPPIDKIALLTPDDSLAARILEFWTRDYLAHRWVVATLAGLLIAYLGYLLLLGPAPSNVFGNDVFLLLDGGWRILNGQVPNHDFYLSLGPLIYMWTAAGLWLAHDSAYGLTIGILSFAALTTVLAFRTSRTRMTAAGSILFSVFVLLLCTGPAPLGSNSSLDLGYAMVYNRFGYGLLSILFITQMLRPSVPRAGPRDDWFAGVAGGASLSLLFFLKISYFAVGGGLVLLVALADLKNTRRLLALACGFVPTTLAMLVFLRFDVPALFHDLRDTVYARSAGISSFRIGELFELSATSLVAVALAFCLLGVSYSSARQRMILFGATIYTILSESLLAHTNGSQSAIYPLYIVVILILLAELAKAFRAMQPGSAAFAATLVVIGLGLTAPTFFVDLRSLALLTRYKTSVKLKAGAYRVEGDQLRDLAFYDNNKDEPVRLENGHFYTGYLNDGIELLKKHSSANDLVASLSFHNPFSFALLRKPPRAGSTWLLMDNNISAGHMLSDARMFGDATVVMVPKYMLTTHVATDRLLFREYKPYLLANFSFVAESKWWSLYRRSSRR
jgi:hypothetical protein